VLFLSLRVRQPCLLVEKGEKISVFRGAKLLTCPGRSHVSDRPWLDADEYESCVGGDVREGGCDQVVIPWDLPKCVRTPQKKILKQNP
jgi:hypothetical protein